MKDGRVRSAARNQAAPHATRAKRSVRWFWHHTGRVTKAQRSALMAVKRRTLANMLRMVRDGRSLQANGPNGQWWSRASGKAKKGKAKQQRRSAKERLRNQTPLTVRRSSKAVTQMTALLPKMPRRKMRAYRARMARWPGGTS
ncbi:hypothetical protein AV530_019879 [Patagioenas fasciata monilis]|uniref:Uncharacterized protein n=1 Tax=Patagioenas fasciata monilis TaxID=372326 RepID=A0A1V4KE22_PATFA|nr:hypothetical protein AV530_019879 [Patagioenas fasciata monilis]